MGVRMALGSTSAALRVMLLREGLRPVMGGALAGIAAAALGARVAANLVSGAAPVGMAGLAGLLAFLGGIAAAAILAASRDLARVDVAEVLRSE